MRHLSIRIVFACVVLVGSAVAGLAQGTQSTPPVTTQPNPQSQPGATIVINPTVEQCNSGWSADTKWTKEQFDEFCVRLRAAK